jgi:hypothetical protein
MRLEGKDEEDYRRDEGKRITKGNTDDTDLARTNTDLKRRWGRKTVKTGHIERLK